MGASGITRVFRIGRNVADHPPAPSRGPVTDLGVPYDSGLTRDHRVIADRRAPGDTDLRHDECVPYRDIMGNVTTRLSIFVPEPIGRIGSRSRDRS